MICQKAEILSAKFICDSIYRLSPCRNGKIKEDKK